MGPVYGASADHYLSDHPCAPGVPGHQRRRVTHMDNDTVDHRLLVSDGHHYHLQLGLLR